MQSTTINYLPTPLPEFDFLPRGEGDISVDYFIAGYNGSLLGFEHKITLSGGGQVVQMMTQDRSGMFTVALPQNAFLIDNDFLGIQMYAPVSGPHGFEYSIRMFKNDTTRNSVVPGTRSQIVLSDAQNTPPQVTFAEVIHQIGSSIVHELNFIGTIDIRGAYTAKVTIRPGEAVYVKRNADGDTVFQF
ncbi:MAG TPA: hypothetical protein PK228_07540 [Saprospiraceae bacterium]|nr:hypothetical protein [Saprospiraceae bacterium]